MKNNIVIPTYAQFIENTFIALKELGGSGKNTEINDKVAQLMNLPDDVLDVPHLNSSSMSEVNYRCAWARTLLKNHGAIENSARSVWAITAAFASVETVDGDYIEKNCKKPSQTKNAPAEVQMENAGVEIPEGLCRGTLFLDVARICEHHHPSVIFCENVKGLVIHDRGRTLQIIKKTFTDLGYTVFTNNDTTLNSKNFGVPQNRERIYIVAFRNDIAPEKFEFPQGNDDTKRIKDIIEENPVPAKYYLSDVYLETLRRHKARHEAKGNGFGYEVRGMEDIAGAIVCGGMGRERNLIVDNRQTNLTPTTHIKGEVNREGIRKMTPREWARLQGFPDTFKLPLADVHLYKQFGNSVTVNVIEAIAEKIKEVLDNATDRK